jgi:hypothetical protein
MSGQNRHREATQAVARRTKTLGTTLQLIPEDLAGVDEA